MLIRKLIELLEEEYQRQLPYEEIMGPPTIVFDVFKQTHDGKFTYQGFSTEDIKIETAGDGVYRILSAMEESYV